MNRIMLNGTVLIKRLDTETEMTDGGIVKPETAIQRSNRGEVKAIGSDEKEVKVGDVVVFTRYGGTETEIDGQELVIVNRKQIYWFERYATLSKVV